MSNCVIDTLKENGLIITAEAFITNSTFKDVQPGGMTIKGTTRLVNATFNNLSKGGIFVEDGLLMLSNVRIDTAEESSIVASPSGGVSFQNVTVGDQMVHWRGYLTPDFATLNHSLVFLNKPHLTPSAPLSPPPSTSSTTSTTTTTTHPTNNGTFPPKASSIVQTSQTTSKIVDDISKGYESPEAFEATASNSSWKWAGAGIGFFLGLLVGCCIFVAVKVIK